MMLFAEALTQFQGTGGLQVTPLTAVLEFKEGRYPSTSAENNSVYVQYLKAMCVG
jgi:hypothetical protein